MRSLRRFLRQPLVDRRLLVQATVLHAVVAVAVRVMTFARLRRLLRSVAEWGRRADPIDDLDARVVRAVRAVSGRLPGANCLTDALVAQCLLARHHCESTLCFGVAAVRPADRPFDAHAWLERRGAAIIGQRAMVYDPLLAPSRCAPSPSSR